MTTNGGGACGAADLKIDPSVAVSTATPVGGGGGGGTVSLCLAFMPDFRAENLIEIGHCTSHFKPNRFGEY